MFPDKSLYVFHSLDKFESHVSTKFASSYLKIDPDKSGYFEPKRIYRSKSVK